MPRAGLSEDRVVEEATHLADEGGAVTLVEVARRLGVQVPSLYKHVDGADALQALVAARAKRELADTLARATVGKSGPSAVDALARAYRTWADAHPGSYASTLRAPSVDNAAEVAASDKAVGVLFDALAGFGLHGDDAIDATRYCRAVLHGFVALEAANGFGLPGVDRTFEKLITALQLTLTYWPSLTI